MPNIYGGTAAFKDVYVGTNKVSAVYVGTTKVWPNVVTLYTDPAPADNLADWSTGTTSRTLVGWGIKIVAQNGGGVWWSQINFTPVVGKLVTVTCNVNELGLGVSVQPVKFAALYNDTTFITDTNTIIGNNIITFTPTVATTHQMRFGQFAAGDKSNANVTVNSVLITQEA